MSDAVGGNDLTEAAFFYLRHGETDWNRDDLIQGVTDVPLNDTGRAQAAEAAERFRGVEVSTLCVSPLSRARETADIVNRVLRRPVDVIDELAEVGFGVKEGVPRGDLFREWEQGRTPEGAEPYDAFMARALAAVNQALARPGPVLIVAHGGVYRAVRERVGLGDTLRLANALALHHQPPGPEAGGWRVAPLP